MKRACIEIIAVGIRIVFEPAPVRVSFSTIITHFVQKLSHNLTQKRGERCESHVSNYVSGDTRKFYQVDLARMFLILKIVNNIFVQN